MRRYAKRRGEEYVSQCRWCRTAMVREDSGDWITRDRWENQQAAQQADVD